MFVKPLIFDQIQSLVIARQVPLNLLISVGRERGAEIVSYCAATTAPLLFDLLFTFEFVWRLNHICREVKSCGAFGVLGSEVALQIRAGLALERWLLLS